MGAQHQLYSCYPPILNQVDSFHVPMLLLITWFARDLCHNSRHVKCPVEYVHTYYQTRNFCWSIFLKWCQTTENWQVTFMAGKEVWAVWIFDCHCLCLFSVTLALVVVNACVSVPPCSVKWSSNMLPSEMLFLDFSSLPLMVCPGLWHKYQCS